MHALKAQEQALGLEEPKTIFSANVSDLTKEQCLVPQPCPALSCMARGERCSGEDWREVTSYLPHISCKVTSVSCGLLQIVPSNFQFNFSLVKPCSAFSLQYQKYFLYISTFFFLTYSTRVTAVFVV